MKTLIPTLIGGLLIAFFMNYEFKTRKKEGIKSDKKIEPELIINTKTKDTIYVYKFK